MIEINNDILKVVINKLGASIKELYFFDKQMIVKNPLNSFCEDYRGCTIGPMSGRLYIGIYKINDIDFKLEQNDNKHTLHNGDDGFHKTLFKIKNVEDDYVILSHCNESFEYFNVIYKVIENKFTISYEYLVNEDTFMNPTNHTYFNLNDDTNVNHLINGSGCMLHNNEEHIITNKKPVIFKNVTLTKKLLNNYIYTNETIEYSNHKYSIKIITNYPGFQVYNAYYSNFQGTCFEASFPPNDYQGTKKSLALANKKYNKEIVFEFKIL